MKLNSGVNPARWEGERVNPKYVFEDNDEMEDPDL